MIQIITCRVGQPAAIEKIKPGLEAMQKLVDGFVDCRALTPTVDLWCNDEGLYKCEPNRLVTFINYDENLQPVSIERVPIHGDFFLAQHDDEGETVSLSGPDVMEWLDIANHWPVALVEFFRAAKGERP